MFEVSFVAQGLIEPMISTVTTIWNSPGRPGRDVVAREFRGTGRLATAGAAAKMSRFHHTRWCQQHARSLELWHLGCTKAVLRNHFLQANHSTSFDIPLISQDLKHWQIIDGRNFIFISNVGAAGFCRCRVLGVPLAVVPIFGDQPVNADVVASTGAGVSFRYPRETLTVPALKEATNSRNRHTILAQLHSKYININQH